MASRDDAQLTRRRLAALAVPAPPGRAPAPERHPGPDPWADPDPVPVRRGRHAWPADREPDPEPLPGPELPVEPDPDPVPDPELEPVPEPGPRPGRVRVLTPRVAGHWQERWVPQRWRGGRWDPGRRGGLALAVVAAAAAVLAAVGVWRERPVVEPLPALPVVVAAAQTGASPSGAATSTAATELVVSVVGAVPAPGLVRVPPGARVADAVAAAGGALPGTDTTTLNLAQPVADGEQVVVGAAGPPASGTSSGAAAAGSGGAAGGPASGGKVSLNTADATALDALPGVGPVTAQAIVDHRTENGPFTSVDQLTEVTGIGDARLATLRDLVVV